MSDIALESVEAAMHFARGRGGLLAEDVANARTPGFVARDEQLAENDSGTGPPFAAVMQDVNPRGSVGLLEYAMGAQARNAAK